MVFSSTSIAGPHKDTLKDTLKASSESQLIFARQQSASTATVSHLMSIQLFKSSTGKGKVNASTGEVSNTCIINSKNKGTPAGFIRYT